MFPHRILHKYFRRLCQITFDWKIFYLVGSQLLCHGLPDLNVYLPKIGRITCLQIWLQSYNARGTSKTSASSSADISWLFLMSKEHCAPLNNPKGSWKEAGIFLMFNLHFRKEQINNCTHFHTFIKTLLQQRFQFKAPSFPSILHTKLLLHARQLLYQYILVNQPKGNNVLSCGIMQILFNTQLEFSINSRYSSILWIKLQRF